MNEISIFFDFLSDLPLAIVPQLFNSWLVFRFAHISIIGAQLKIHWRPCGVDKNMDSYLHKTKYVKVYKSLYGEKWIQVKNKHG